MKREYAWFIEADVEVTVLGKTRGRASYFFQSDRSWGFGSKDLLEFDSKAEAQRFAVLASLTTGEIENSEKRYFGRVRKVYVKCRMKPSKK